MSAATLDFCRPGVELIQPSHSSAGREAVDLAAMAGLVLDPWEAHVLEHALAERSDGRWSAFEVGVNVPRQNGKGSILEARELAGLYLLGERLIIHSAHQFDTSLEAFRRLLGLIEETPELSRRIKRISRSHGEEGIELVGGQRVRFRTRTKGGGRGFTGDCLILDEAMILPESSHGALLPTLAARPNPQVWYTGSAVDQRIHHDGVVWARVRERGHAGVDSSLVYFEWSIDPRTERQVEDGTPVGPSQVTETLAASPTSWEQANPGLGIRISPDHVEHERRAMDPRTFAVERLGVGDWPDTDPSGNTVIDLTRWRGLTDPASQMIDPVHIAFDVTPDRGSASICAAGRREDGLIHVEVIDERSGTGWVVGRLVELLERYSPAAILCDGTSPAASLVDDAEGSGLTVTTLSTAEYVAACGTLFDRVEDGGLRHLGSPALEASIRGAAKRPLVDAWAWSRKASKLDISPLVAATVAVWSATLTGVPNPYATKGLLVI